MVLAAAGGGVDVLWNVFERFYWLFFFVFVFFLSRFCVWCDYIFGYVLKCCNCFWIGFLGVLC